MIKKAKIDDKIVDVVSFESYVQNKTSYPPNYTAVEFEDVILPIRRRSDTRPGVYNHGPMTHIIKPIEEEHEDYSIVNMIDFDNISSIKEVIEKQSALRSMERTILTTKDNIFTPSIGDNDSPEMAALKEAVIDKRIDLDKYEQRFGPNYNNDKRLFTKDSITLVKLKSIANALDMSLTLIIKDKSPDVPNPIGREIVANLTPDDDELWSILNEVNSDHEPGWNNSWV